MRDPVCTFVALLVGCFVFAGCEAAYLIGGMAQNFEYQKEIEVLAEYDLAGKTVAIVVDADMVTLYEFPDLVAHISSGVAARIQRHVDSVRVLDPRLVLAWQYNTPQWNGMPYGDIAQDLNVDRVVYINIQEYRLHPPGNRWEWEGVCAADVGIIERGSIAPDSFAAQFTVVGRFPSIKGVGRDAATAEQIEVGVLAEFIKRTAWLFYDHLEPKYPDKYRQGA
jgi:hypothetical protein